MDKEISMFCHQWLWRVRYTENVTSGAYNLLESNITARNMNEAIKKTVKARKGGPTIEIFDVTAIADITS